MIIQRLTVESKKRKMCENKDEGREKKQGSGNREGNIFICAWNITEKVKILLHMNENVTYAFIMNIILY